MITTVTITEDGIARNEYGTPVGVHQCSTCGHYFTTCPTTDQRDPYWQDCLSLECDSYDVERDVDLMFEIEPWKIRREEAS